MPFNIFLCCVTQLDSSEKLCQCLHRSVCLSNLTPTLPLSVHKLCPTLSLDSWKKTQQRNEQTSEDLV